MSDICLAEVSTDSLFFPKHNDCFVCGSENPRGLRMRFQRTADGSIIGTTICDAAYQSFDGIVHGGILASLLDGAMTHCLLTRSIRALTAELSIRYLKSVRPAEPLTLTAQIVRERNSFYMLAAVLIQDESICCRATGKFIKTS